MPMSVKGIVFEGDTLWLRKNEHGRWEIPGGRLDDGEQPEQTVVRELAEELGLEVTIETLLDTRILEKTFGSTPIIAIVTFLCRVNRRVGDFEHEGEGGAVEFRQYTIDEALKLDTLPDVYKQAIQRAREYRESNLDHITAKR